ncbi:hypothetical protein M9Y10_023535 [Tritrichomonas musculus]|uniref:Leucine Rich Repeat family protein n=1 Tax=Tritrichomonas musculus TaxID=1915356 RepID=A0ABR2KVM2_9EUKA
MSIYGRRFSIMPNLFLLQKPKPEGPDMSVVYDFNNKDDFNEEEGTLWETYTKLCYSQTPPIPALSLMRPILSGDKQDALFPHQQISNHLPVILNLLKRMKAINNLDLSDNSLRPDCAQPLIDFVQADEQLSSLNIADNPLIGAKAMTELLDGIKESLSLETLIISNTGCNKHVSTAIAQVIDGCKGLLKLDISCCDLRQNAIEIAQMLPNNPKIKLLNLSRNSLYVGGRRFATQLGTNVGKCESLKKLDLSYNALTSEQVTVLMKGLANAPHLSSLNLSKNCIDETGGKPIAIFLGKTTSLKFLDISQNQLLNVTVNKIRGQQKLEEDQKKPGGKDKKKSSVYTPGVYWIVNYLMKNGGLPQKPIKIRMIGLVVDKVEWDQKLEALKETNSNIEIIYQAPCNLSFHFTRPNTAIPPVPPALSASRNSARSPATARRQKK